MADKQCRSRLRCFGQTDPFSTYACQDHDILLTETASLCLLIRPCVCPLNSFEHRGTCTCPTIASWLLGWEVF